jgi:hypothetical protein
MAQKKWDFAPLVAARKVLDPIWKKSQSRGRTWGIKSDHNPLQASNIMLANEGEVVLVTMQEDGGLVVHQYCRCIGGTKLGNEVLQALRQADLHIVGKGEKPASQIGQEGDHGDN